MQTASHTSPTSQKQNDIWKLSIGALGVVFGDIGTSPLYAFRETIAHTVEPGAPVAVNDVLGILSLILWTLMIIVTIKYVAILLRIDNRGEGGTLALMALARTVLYRNTTFLMFLGIIGAALFFGDAVITPAISVLSAVEGLKVVMPSSEPFILPIALTIIIGLFLAQSKGTAKVSTLFGPIMVVWFTTLGLTGMMHINDDPTVLRALNPYYALHFIVEHKAASFIALGSVFLAVTGAEALYADLGHFGRSPIRLTWGWFVMPALALNYLGQGALVLSDPSAADNPFFKLVGKELQLPLVLLATCATIIASQAVITGAFSLTRQAVNLGLLPRMRILHTSDKHSGQIYMPQVNYILMTGVILLVLLFKTSSDLAAAYGISVTGSMVVDAIMMFFVIWWVWEWPVAKALVLVLPFFLIEMVFLSSNMLKIAAGGWMPLMLAGLMVAVVLTWIKGNIIINSRARKRDYKTDKFIQTYKERYPGLRNVEGSAFFLTGDPELTPQSLLQNIKHNRVLHENNIILSIKTEPYPYVDADARAIVSRLDENFSLLVLRFGFSEIPDVQTELVRLNRQTDSGIDFDWEKTSVFLNRRVLRSHPNYGLPAWQDFLYVWLHKHASEPTDFYRLPVGRVIEIGRHVII